MDYVIQWMLRPNGRLPITQPFKYPGASAQALMVRPNSSPNIQPAHEWWGLEEYKPHFSPDPDPNIDHEAWLGETYPTCSCLYRRQEILTSKACSSYSSPEVDRYDTWTTTNTRGTTPPLKQLADPTLLIAMAAAVLPEPQAGDASNVTTRLRTDSHHGREVDRRKLYRGPLATQRHGTSGASMAGEKHHSLFWASEIDTNALPRRQYGIHTSAGAITCHHILGVVRLGRGRDGKAMDMLGANVDMNEGT